MNDLISRQAAIDKVDRIVKVNHLNPDMVWFTPNGVKTLMEDLPSAEPDDAEANYWHEKANSYEQTLVKLTQSMAEQPEIIRCKECRWWDKSDDSPYGYCRAMKHGYFSANWEIGIYRRYKGDFYCADAEKEGQ